MRSTPWAVCQKPLGSSQLMKSQVSVWQKWWLAWGMAHPRPSPWPDLLLQPGPGTATLLHFYTFLLQVFIVDLDRLFRPIFSRMILLKKIRSFFLEHPQFFLKVFWGAKSAVMALRALTVSGITSSGFGCLHPRSILWQSSHVTWDWYWENSWGVEKSWHTPHWRPPELGTSI